jgi:hypothetical protein
MVTDDEMFLERFESALFPCSEWHHREHIKIGYLYLQRLPLEAAMDRMREKLEALNRVHQVPDLPNRGYHETMTEAWLRLVDVTLREFGPAATADAFCDQNPQLLEKRVLRFFYSRELLTSARAKREFVAPDLAPLPQSRRGLLRQDGDAREP